MRDRVLLRLNGDRRCPLCRDASLSALSRAGNAFLRRTILAAADERRDSAVRAPLRDAARRGPVRRGRDARRVPWRCCGALNEQGLHANTTILGERCPQRAEAAAVAAEYERVLEQFAGGAAPGERRAQAHAPRARPRRGARLRQPRARGATPRRRLRNFIRIDMEESSVASTRRSASTVACGRKGTTGSASCCRRICSARAGDLDAAAPISRPTCGSSRAHTWSRRPSPTRRRRTSTPAYCDLVEQALPGVRTPASPPTTSG